jgi:hypothetical protein
VAVGPQQDFRIRPVGPDGPHQAAQEGPDLGALWPLGRTQHGGDQPTLAIEHDNRLEAVVVIVGIEQPQLLAAVCGIEGVVDVEHDALRHLAKRGAIEVDHGTAHAQQDPDIGQIFQP